MDDYSITVISAGLSQTKTYTVSQVACQALVLTTSTVSPAICSGVNGSAKVVATGVLGT
jgi:hypothetical protein